MRLAMYRLDEQPARPALVSAAGIHDIGRHVPEAPTDMLGILQSIERWRAPFQQLLSARPDSRLEQVRIAAPIARPPKILALGLNYRDHAVEANIPLPEHQTWFAKMPTASNGPFDPVHLPRVSDKLDYEAELAFVVGKRARHVSRDQAREFIAGFCCANDVSVRDWQFRTSQFVIGKSFDTHCPFGPWIVTTDEIPDPQALTIRCTVNEEPRQDSNTREMVFDVYQMIEHLSQAMTLEPGDLILTGTPAGVGAVRNPRCYLRAGDVVRVEIEKIGAIENRIVDEPA